jgi:hypothetical protein
VLNRLRVVIVRDQEIDAGIFRRNPDVHAAKFALNLAINKKFPGVNGKERLH